jgi:beta-barrel assembly-enhancing protease
MNSATSSPATPCASRCARPGRSASWASSLGDFAGGAAVLFLTERLIQASYTREAEGAADAFAHGTLIDARVRPDALATFFETLVEESGESSGIVRHFLSHPDLGDRIAAARAAAGGVSVDYEASLSPADWQALRAICD